MTRNSQLKIFIGGIPRDVTDGEFSAYFNTFGELQGCALIRDSMKASRGFGFVTCRNQCTYDAIFGTELQLRGKRLEPKKAVPQGQVEGTSRNVKMFIGGLPPQIEKSDLHTFFSKFGVLKEAVVMLDSMTGKSRGFGFITFQKEDSVEEVLKNPQFEIGGKMIQCRRAQPASTLGGVNRQKGAARTPNMGGVNPYSAMPVYGVYRNAGTQQPTAPIMVGYRQPVFAGNGGGAHIYAPVPAHTGYVNTHMFEAQQGNQGTQPQIQTPSYLPAYTGNLQAYMGQSRYNPY